jgi:L-aminopeptidase/D-esterase-like protein
MQYALDGLAIGHYTDLTGVTGCTVLLLGQDDGAVTGVSVRGAAPGTRETDLLQPGCLVEKAHAILLSGGSAFGLDAASGVMQFLEERGIGHPTTAGPVPIVPAAVLYDLSIGDPKARPDATSGYSACVAAGKQPAIEGSFGAGAGATVGKINGIGQATKGGIGIASLQILDGITVMAVVAVNCFGDVVDPDNGTIIAGVRQVGARSNLGTESILRAVRGKNVVSDTTNTTIGVVATNARLSKAQARWLADIAHDGIARTTRPSHSIYDGDTLFAVSMPSADSPVIDTGQLAAVGSAATEVVATAIIRAVRLSTGMGGVPSINEL